MYQWKTDDYGSGGPDGTLTLPIKQLAERDEHLKKLFAGEAGERRDADIGLSLIDYTEKQTAAVPELTAGSRFELNGSFYRITENALPENFEGIADGRAYVYAAPLGGGEAALRFENAQPVFDAAKGGFYHPSEPWRCLMSCWKSGSQCRAKAAMGARLFTPPRPFDTEGVLIASATEEAAEIDIEAGWYKVALAGGRGGNGGQGGRSGTWAGSNGAGAPVASLGGQAGGAGGAGSLGQAQEFFLFLEKGSCELLPGRSGNAGQPGGAGADGRAGALGSGDGGNGADGEPSRVLNNGKLAAQAAGGGGGQGGKGAAGSVGVTGSLPSVIAQHGTVGIYNGVPVQGQTGWQLAAGSTQAGKQANGGTGGNGSGFAAAVTGSVRISAL